MPTKASAAKIHKTQLPTLGLYYSSRIFRSAEVQIPLLLLPTYANICRQLTIFAYIKTAHAGKIRLFYRTSGNEETEVKDLPERDFIVIG